MIWRRKKHGGKRVAGPPNKKKTVPQPETPDAPDTAGVTPTPALTLEPIEPVAITPELIQPMVIAPRPAELTAEPEGEEPAAEAEDETEEEEPLTLGERIRGILIKVVILGVFISILFVGLCVMLYPSISNFINTKNQSRAIEGLKTAMKSITPEQYIAMLNDARRYNDKLAGTGLDVRDAFAAGQEDKEKESEYWDLLNISGGGMMGRVAIESLGIDLPIYHGTSEATLAKGVGHIQGSSLPVGGESTHATISAHTGLPSARLFTGIDTLREGDTFTIYVLDQMLTYQVDQILKVLPHEIEALAIAKGSDYVTLVTCTPYGINSHRLFVRGTRVENPPEKQNEMLAEAEEEAEVSWALSVYRSVVAFLSNVIEAVAVGIVSFSEWFMNLFGIQYS